MKHSMLSVLAVSLFTLLHIDPAAAQNTRSWVSGTGSDALPCTRTSPCLTFAGALATTFTGGEINGLHSGDGIVAINTSISIRCVAVTPAMQTPGFAIGINAPAGSEVLLDGLDIDGQGSGLDGVSIFSAARVTIQNCSIRNFNGNGVNLTGPLGARVVIIDSTILSNNVGLRIAGAGGAANVGILLRTIIDNHPVASVAVAAGSTVFMSGAKLFGSATSVSLAGGATFTSFGDNAIQAAGTPSFTIPLR